MMTPQKKTKKRRMANNDIADALITILEMTLQVLKGGKKLHKLIKKKSRKLR